MAVDKDEIILGSGDLYILDVPEDGAIPQDSVIETDGNNVGHISGGASMEYKPTTYEVENDKREVLKRVITKEEVTFKSGILTFSNKNIERLSTGRIAETTKEITLKIGGGSSLRRNLVRFVHTKDNGFKLRITLLGSPSDGFTLTFAKDKETIVDAVIKALSQKDGTLVEIRDQIGDS